MCKQADRHTIHLIILVDDKPVTQGRVVGDSLDAMLIVANEMKSRAMAVAADAGVIIDRLRERYDAEEASDED